jgi:phosphatidylglycerol lysyltransferase
MLKILHRIGLLLPYALFLVAGYVVHRQVTIHPMRDVMRSIGDIPWQYIAAGSVLTIINYMFLACYDWLGIRYAGHKVPFRRMILTAFISYAISNNTGHAIVSGTSVRYRY